MDGIGITVFDFSCPGLICQLKLVMAFQFGVFIGLDGFDNRTKTNGAGKF